MNVKNVLALKRDTLISTDDDKLAREILLDLGLLRSHKVSTLEAITEFEDHNFLEFHFLIVGFFSGRKKVSDNGYVLFFLPRSKYTRQKAVKFLADLIESQKPKWIEHMALMPN